MARCLVCLLLVGSACRPAQSPIAAKTGMVLALAGVAGIIGSALASPHTEHSDEAMLGFEVMSAVGIVLYAAHEMSGREVVYKRETTSEKHHRWAKILTAHAAGAAREGNCARVRKFEPRVLIYDAHVHDFVFMRDPEILRCLSPLSPTAP